jgi:hypothetical protein
MAGAIDGIQVTQMVLVGNAVMMVIKSVMVFLSLTVPFPIIRWVNIVLVISFIGIIIMQLGYYFTSDIQKWAYYYVFTLSEIGLYALIVWYAWNWV